jgi:hypothetical protein
MKCPRCGEPEHPDQCTVPARIDPRDPDPSREGMWRYNNCSYCDNGRKTCKQGKHNHCSNPHARND